MTQSKLLSNTEQNLKTESKLIISTTVTDYMNGLIDKDTFYQKLDEHAADMDAEIWLSTAMVRSYTVQTVKVLLQKI